MCTEMSLCIDVAGFVTIPLHRGRRAVLALWAPKADGSVVAIKRSRSLSVARLRLSPAREAGPVQGFGEEDCSLSWPYMLL